MTEAAPFEVSVSLIRTKTKSQSGYMLLAVMLMVTVMLLTLSIVLPRISQQLKREKEEELKHRGEEYAMAIKRYYHATAISHGTYPTSLDQLEHVNNMRFLRRRFKDPMTEDGEWKLVHYGEAEIKRTGPGGAIGGLPGSGAGTNPLGRTNPLGGASPSPSPSGSPAAPGAGPAGAGGNSSGGPFGSQTSNPLQGGGGYIIGVASKSKQTSIKEFNGNNQYDQWLFVYDPSSECQQLPGTSATPIPCQGNGIVIASPRGTNASPLPPPPGAPPSVTPVPGIGPAPGTSPTPGTNPTPGPGASPTP